MSHDEKAPALLPEPERLSQALLEAAPTALYIFDLDERRPIFVNPWGLELLGLGGDGTSGPGPDFFVQRMHPDDQSRAEAHFEHFAITVDGEAREFEYRMRAADGEWRWFRSRDVVFARDLDGRPRQLLGMALDITERKQMEEALRESESRFRTSVETMLDAFGVYAAVRDEAGAIVDFRVEYVNDAACAANRMTREEQVGQLLCELLPGHRDSGLFDAYCRLVETGEPLSKELLDYEDAYDGQRLRRAFDIEATKLGDGFAASWRDVTERRRFEDELRDRERFVSGVINAAPGLVYVYDLATGRNLYVNDQMERLFGWTRQDLERLGDGFLFTMIHPDDLEEVRRQAKRCPTLADGEVIELEYRFRQKDGGWRWVRSRDTVFARDAGGNVVQILGLADDVTERKQSEGDLTTATAQLEAMLDNLPVGLAFFDRELRFVRVNPEMARMNGRSAGAHRGQRLEDVLPASGPEIRKRIEEVFATGQGISNVEVSGPSPLYNGQIGHALASWYPVRVGDETVLVGAAVFDISERKQAEEALRRSELIFRRLADTNLFGVGFGDLSGNVTYVNDEMLRMMGRTRVEFEAGTINWAESLAPEHRADALRTGEELLRDGEAIGYERAFLRPDGGRTPYLGAAALVSPDSDFHVSIALDLTQIQRVEASLRDSETRFRTMADETPVIIWVTDAAGGLEFVNRAYTEFFGVTEEEVRGPNWQPLLHPDDAEAYVSAFRAALDVGASFHAEARVRRADGAWRWIESFGAPRLSASGKSLGMVGSSPDITGRKEAEAEQERHLAEESRVRQAAEEAEARFRGLFEGVADALLVADADGRYRDANPAALALLGYSRDELMELRVADVVASAPEWTEAEYTRYRDEGSWRGELELRRNDGSIVPVEALATVVALPAGPMYLSAVRDISERKQAETERVSFLDAVAHDVKNPLTAAKGQTQLLQRRLQQGAVDTTRLEATLAGIVAAIDASVALVDDLLDAAHLRAGRSLDLRLAPIDLVALAEVVTAETRESTTQHGIKVEADFAELVGVWDGRRLRRVLANLLGNAVKYSPDGGEILVRIGRETDAAGEAWAVLTVTDQGIGIPAADVPHLFGRFHRGSNVAHIGGTGIGLAGARQIAEQHGGSIDVFSEEGHGSAFTVRLPLGPVQA